MNFLLTTYVYPLARPIELSKHLNIQLDNPRTKQEISAVENHLVRASYSGEDYAIPIHSNEDVVTVENTLLQFRDTFSGTDSYVRKRFKSYRREKALSFLASIWIVARYDDNGEATRLAKFHKRMRAKGQLTFSLLEDGHPIVKGETMVCDYSYLLSLLMNSEGNGYYGRGFIIADPEPTRIQDQSMWFQLLTMTMVCSDQKKKRILDDSLRWIFFSYARELLETKAKLIDHAIENGLADKLLYVGSLLRIAAEAKNDNVRLILLTSILELLVTHNPDHNRFNIDESISKQFRLKVGLLVYLNNKQHDLDTIKERLKVIYNQRSNLAHGNFLAVNKYLNSLSKDEGHEEYFSDLITDLYVYTRAVLEEYLKDKKLVEFLKAY